MLALEPETRITAFVSAELPEDVRRLPWAQEVEWVRFPINVTHGPPWNMALTMGAQWGVEPVMARRRRLDVVHGLANITPLAGGRTARVVTLLDLIWIHYPRTMARRATIGMKIVAPTSARRAHRVIAISEAAKRDLHETLGLDAAKIDVTPLGVNLDATVAPADEAELRTRLGLGEDPVVLCVAQKREHKNLTALVGALAQARDRTARLVLPGSSTPHEQELAALAADLGVAERVHFPEWVSEADLEGLYRLASCFVLPSFMEGFGLPVLEAMRRDVPVACSAGTALEEVAGDAALLFDPHDTAQIAGAIDRLLEDAELRADLVRRGRAPLPASSPGRRRRARRSAPTAAQSRSGADARRPEPDLPRARARPAGWRPTPAS